jgi:hypothetical protein
MKKLLLIFVLMLAMAGFTKAQVVADFESGTSPFVMHSMANGHLDADTTNFAVVDNPDVSGINTSTKVVKFTRAFDGNPWAGFWTALDDSIDVTTNKFMHVKVLKTRISPLHFKLEGGPAGNSEIPSMYAQTVTNGWEDIVFDFRAKTGKYKVFSFMPDFEDPVTLTEDIVMYFDDIVLNNDSMPINSVVTLNVDVHGLPLTATDTLFIAGDFGGIHGTWNEPGFNLNNILTDPNADSVYTITLNLSAGTYHYKFFKNRGWNTGGEWNGDPNRTIIVNGDISTTVKWGVKPVNVTLNVDMHGSGLAAGETVYFAGNFGGSYGVWNAPGTNPANVLTDANADSIYTTTIIVDSIGTYEFKFFKGNGWDGGEWNGGANRSITIAGDSTLDFLWGSPAGIHENQLASQIQVYPNPFSANLFINTTTDISQIIISNYIGQQVARFENLKSGLMSVNTSDLKKGMYLVTFFAKDGSKYTQKLVKN